MSKGKTEEKWQEVWKNSVAFNMDYKCWNSVGDSVNLLLKKDLKKEEKSKGSSGVAES